MSALDELDAFLKKSPSCIEPWEVRPYLDVIEAENAKLRDERDRMYKANVEKNGEILRLLEENAKLRELLLHMYTCMGNVDADGNHECFSCEYEGAECDYDRRLRELGVEVDR